MGLTKRLLGYIKITLAPHRTWPKGPRWGLYFGGVTLPFTDSVKRAMAFFDAQNLYRHAKDAFGHHHPNFDPVKLHTAICESKGWRSAPVRFYTGVPAADRSAMWHGYWNNRILALKRSGVHVTTRPIRYRIQKVEGVGGSVEETVVPQEKGIDIRLALDLVSLARKRQFDVAIIYSQDQDLNEVVAEVKEIAADQNRPIVVASAFPAGPRATSRYGIRGAEWIKMDQAFYEACLDPRDYRPKLG